MLAATSDAEKTAPVDRDEKTNPTFLPNDRGAEKRSIRKISSSEEILVIKESLEASA
ncbi:hypothetical protein [Lysinibacter cavernae]|uniref:hypothetical protein n=1 Tax=Lysinibacter cavernae TaxID=1640652 RepID=UPI00360CAF72